MVWWESPQDNGGVEIENYILSLYQEDQTVFQTTTQSLELSLSLNYSTNYSITLTATNCAGNSSPVSLTSMQGEWSLYVVTTFLLPQVVAELHHLQSMVVLRSTAVQRREQRSSSTVMMDTLLMR